MKIQSPQYLPVSVEVGRVSTEKYAWLIKTFFLPMYFNENFYTLRLFTLRCKQTFIEFFLYVPLSIPLLIAGTSTSTGCTMVWRIKQTGCRAGYKSCQLCISQLES